MCVCVCVGGVIVSIAFLLPGGQSIPETYVTYSFNGRPWQGENCHDSFKPSCFMRDLPSTPPAVKELTLLNPMESTSCSRVRFHTTTTWTSISTRNWSAAIVTVKGT